MRSARLLVVAISAVLAFSHTPGLRAAASEATHGSTARGADYGQLKRIIHKDHAATERFGELIETLKSAAKKSNPAHRQGVIGQILNEMVQEIRLIQHKLSKNYFLTGEGAASDNPVPEGNAAVSSQAHARLTVMEEIYRTCNEIQNPAIEKQKNALKTFTGKSKEFYGLMLEESNVTRALLPAEYQETGSSSPH